jgi:hypothetical protein
MMRPLHERLSRPELRALRECLQLLLAELHRSAAYISALYGPMQADQPWDTLCLSADSKMWTAAVQSLLQHTM